MIPKFLTYSRAVLLTIIIIGEIKEEYFNLLCIVVL